MLAIDLYINGRIEDDPWVPLESLGHYISPADLAHWGLAEGLSTLDDALPAGATNTSPGEITSGSQYTPPTGTAPNIPGPSEDLPGPANAQPASSLPPETQNHIAGSSDTASSVRNSQYGSNGDVHSRQSGDPLPGQQRYSSNVPSTHRIHCLFKNCPEVFERTHNWARHEQEIHFGLAAFVCRHTLFNTGDECGKGFSRLEGLKKHSEKVHNEWREECKAWRQNIPPGRFSCGFCRATFKDWNKRNTHIAAEFNRGKTKDQWKGNYGYDDKFMAEVRRMVGISSPRGRGGRRKPGVGPAGTSVVTQGFEHNPNIQPAKIRWASAQVGPPPGSVDSHTDRSNGGPTISTVEHVFMNGNITTVPGTADADVSLGE
jgi:hypothetical protein